MVVLIPLRRAVVYEVASGCSHRRLGDLIVYRCAASCEKREKGELVSLEPLEIAVARADKLIRDILHDTEADEYKVFLSGDNNFRYEINPMYKANRVAEDPIHREDLKNFCIQEWKAIVTDGYEADDALGIHQTKDTVICSLDKDLLMIPGNHYSWQISGTSVNGKQWVREAKFTYISELWGLKTFYKQMLIGDTSDNVIGVKGIGEVKAGKLIDPLNTEEGMFAVVHQQYSNPDRFTMNADCLYIWRKEYERFTDRPFVKEMQNLWH